MTSPIGCSGLCTCLGPTWLRCWDAAVSRANAVLAPPGAASARGRETPACTHPDGCSLQRGEAGREQRATGHVRERVVGRSPQVITPLASSLADCSGAISPGLRSPPMWLAGTGSSALLSKPDQHRAANRRCYLNRSQPHENKDHFPPTQHLLLTPLRGDPISLYLPRTRHVHHGPSGKPLLCCSKGDLNPAGRVVQEPDPWGTRFGEVGSSKSHLADKTPVG